MTTYIEENIYKYPTTKNPNNEQFIHSHEYNDIDVRCNILH